MDTEMERWRGRMREGQRKDRVRGGCLALQWSLFNCWMDIFCPTNTQAHRCTPCPTTTTENVNKQSAQPGLQNKPGWCFLLPVGHTITHSTQTHTHCAINMVWRSPASHWCACAAQEGLLADRLILPAQWGSFEMVSLIKFQDLARAKPTSLQL